MLRWFCWIIPLALVLGCAGCQGKEETAAAQTRYASALTFRYDAARDVVLATSHPVSFAAAPGQTAAPSQRYLDTLAALPETAYAPAADLRLADPAAMLANGVLTVNYRDVNGLERMNGTQATAALAACEAWAWTPEVREVRLQAAGKPLIALGTQTISQPLKRPYATYVVQPQTGEIGHLAGGPAPATLAEAVVLLNKRQLRAHAAPGFLPLLPPEVELFADLGHLDNRTLAVDPSPDFSTTEHARLAGLVLMLAQFPEVDAVRFTFGKLTVTQRMMRGDLEKPLSPYDLLLPPAATVAENTAAAAIKKAAQSGLSRPPLSVSPPLVWREWAAVTIAPAKSAPEQTVLLNQDAAGYAVTITGERLLARQAMLHDVPRDAILALRLPGWEGVALEE